jgi:hypothetical protein
LTAVFNDPEIAFRRSRLKRCLIILLGPVHKAGNITLECNNGRNICGNGEAKARGWIPLSVLTLQRSESFIGEEQSSYFTPFSGFHEPCSFLT